MEIATILNMLNESIDMTDEILDSDIDDIPDIVYGLLTKLSTIRDMVEDGIEE